MARTLLEQVEVTRTGLTIRAGIVGHEGYSFRCGDRRRQMVYVRNDFWAPVDITIGMAGQPDGLLIDGRTVWVLPHSEMLIGPFERRLHANSEQHVLIDVGSNYEDRAVDVYMLVINLARW